MSGFDLVRSVADYFRIKGAPPEAVPVVIMDDNSGGPFLPCRAWYGGQITGAVAAQYAYVWVTNEDGRQGQIGPTGPGNSVLVVDEIYAKCLTAADDYFISLSAKGNIIPAVTALSNDAAQEKAVAAVGDPVTNPQLGNVTCNFTNQAGQLWGNNSQRFPGGALGTVTRIPGPFTLGPQGVLAVNPATLANSFICWMRGRYYAAY